jgi:hypothetical protein
LTIRLFHDRRVLLATLGLALVASLVLVMAASGLGGRLDPPEAAADASTSSVQAPEPTASGSSAKASSTTPTPTATQAQNRVTRIIQWLNEQAPLGGGASGPEDEAFGAMLYGDCAHALRLSERTSNKLDRLPERSRSLYEGAGSACLAAFKQRPELWPRAEAALGKTIKHAPRLDCQQQTVYRLLTRLVEVHRAEPNAQLVKRPAGKLGLLKCPRFLKITPGHGPAEGGYPIRLEGENLPRMVGVNFGLEHHIDAVSEDGRHVVITAPPSNPDALVYVWPDGWPWGDANSVEFYYDPSAPTSRPPTTTTRPPTTLNPPTSASSSPSSS